MSTFKKMAGIGVVFGGIAVALTGCSAGGGDHPTEQAATQSAGLSVPAGDDARALGVEEWRLDDNGFIDGVDTAGSVVAQFHAIREEHRVESLLPDKGVKSVDDPQAANTFSARSSELYEVMIYDLSVFARTQAQPSSDTTQGSGLGTEREAYWSVGYNCCYGSSSAIYYYWIYDNGQISPYCHVDTFPYSCSGYPQCYQYAQASGCLYWI